MNRPARRWPIAHLLLTTHLPFLAVCLAGLILLAWLILGGVSAFGSVRISALDVGGPFLRWLALGYGYHLLATMLPTFLVHGRTRREYLLQVPVFQLVTTAVLAGMTTLGYAAETVLYRAAGWPHQLAQDRLYDNTGDYLLIFGNYWTMLLGWMVTGWFLGAAFYRFQVGGVLALPVALGLLLANATGDLPIVDAGQWHQDLGVPVALALAAGGTVVAAVLCWAIARDMPLHTRTS
ncbi:MULTISPECIES: hypothetical protein [Actinoplanes]|uniref:hypothetical protein n=1 Tax=Actinoplanes TaxID=1865 RepID=UPI0005F2E711|nr:MULTISPECIES: hypothetical protein [Actinoplanes]GLY02980.1 hypothetical protein Acsp01_33590 [Actinoplanes sp. NBRC 101535]